MTLLAPCVTARLVHAELLSDAGKTSSAEAKALTAAVLEAVK
jgi:hypothetical protein